MFYLFFDSARALSFAVAMTTINKTCSDMAAQYGILGLSSTATHVETVTVCSVNTIFHVLIIAYTQVFNCTSNMSNRIVLYVA